MHQYASLRQNLNRQRVKADTGLSYLNAHLRAFVCGCPREAPLLYVDLELGVFCCIKCKANMPKARQLQQLLRPIEQEQRSKCANLIAQKTLDFKKSVQQCKRNLDELSMCFQNRLKGPALDHLRSQIQILKQQNSQRQNLLKTFDKQEVVSRLRSMKQLSARFRSIHVGLIEDKLSIQLDLLVKQVNSKIKTAMASAETKLLAPADNGKALTRDVKEVQLVVVNKRLQVYEIRNMAKQSYYKNVIKLDLSSTQLQDQSIQVLSKTTWDPKQLYLSHNLLGNDSVRVIANTWHRVSTLYLHSNCINDYGVQELRRELMPCLRVLTLYQNKVVKRERAMKELQFVQFVKV